MEKRGDQELSCEVYRPIGFDVNLSTSILLFDSLLNWVKYPKFVASKLQGEQLVIVA